MLTNAGVLKNLDLCIPFGVSLLLGIGPGNGNLVRSCPGLSVQLGVLTILTKKRYCRQAKNQSDHSKHSSAVSVMLFGLVNPHVLYNRLWRSPQAM